MFCLCLCLCFSSENDNKPEFNRERIEIKVNENEIDGYKIPFEGGRDVDENDNGEIFYILDCSKEKKSKEFVLNWNETTINCLPLFDLIKFTNSIMNQYDQLGLIYNPSKSHEESSSNGSFDFILYGFNLNRMSKAKQMMNSMQISVQLQKPLFQKIYLKQLQFIVQNLFHLPQRCCRRRLH